MGYELLPLLRDAHVQRELKLTAQQLEAIQSLSEDYLTAATTMHVAGTADKLPADEVHHRVMSLATRYGEPALELLTQEQRRRLDEVIVQLRSIDLFRAAAIVESLGFSAEQVQQVAVTQKRVAVVLTQLRGEMTSKKLDRAAYNDAVHAALVAAEAEVDAILTDAQREQMHQWRGARIDFGRTHLRLAIHSAR